MPNEIIKTIGAFIGGIGLTDAYSKLKRWRCGSEVVILMYHRISPDDIPWLFEVPPLTPKAFEIQLQYLCSHYEVMCLDDMIQSVANGQHSGRRIASITLDDGYKDNISYAFPLLTKYNISATVFLTTGPIDSRSLLWWDKIGYALTYTQNRRLNLGEFGNYYVGDTAQRRAVAHEIISRLETLPDELKNRFIDDLISESRVQISAEHIEETMMTWQDIRAMQNKGTLFGAHTVSHPILTNVPLEHAASEIRESKSQIEKHIHQRIDFFAYPNGDFNSAIAKIVEESGFRGAVTVEPVWITHATNRFKLGRVGPYWDDFNVFKAMLSGIRGDFDRVWNAGGYG